MKRLPVLTLCFVLLFAFTSAAYARQAIGAGVPSGQVLAKVPLKTPGQALSQANAAEQKQSVGTSAAGASVAVAAEIKKTFPRFMFTSVHKTPLPGIYEIDAGSRIFYFSPQGFLFFGDLYSKGGVNITAQRRASLIAANAKDLPLEAAIRIGSGPKKVIEFADPVCPFCRRAFEHLAKRKDITEYVFLFPLAQIHPQALPMSRYILCSADPAKTFSEAMEGKLDGKKLKVPAGCDKEKVLMEDIEAGKKAGVMGTPAFFINGKFVNGANLPLIDKLLADYERR